jgi:hypothetical protein
MHHLIDRKRLDAEIEAAARREREANSALREKMAGAAGDVKVSRRALVEMVLDVQATMAITIKHVARNAASALAALEARVAELEASPFSYEGVHEFGRSYSKNAIVTCGGSMWIAKATTTDRPGNSDSWQLCVKRGARGAR